jgi:hypothetical protein
MGDQAADKTSFINMDGARYLKYGASGKYFSFKV